MSAGFDIETNAPEIAGIIRLLADDQIPFAVAFGITQTARGIVYAQREGMEERFTIRRQWILSGVRMTKRAEKHDWEAHVAVMKDRDFLFRFEDGGTVTPEKASRFSVPKEAGRTGSGVIQKSQKPKSFNFKKWGTGPEVTVYKGERRAFMIRRSDGTGALLRRRGPKGRTYVQTLFTFTPEAKLDALLEFYPTAQMVFDETMPANIQVGLDRALRTAR